MTLNKNFSAYTVTGFLGESICSFLNEIENLVLDMAEEDEYVERLKYVNDIQHVIWKCNAVMQ